MTRRVLHLLSQRPSLTGSGITIDALVRHAALAGWNQMAVVGVPQDDTDPEVGGLDRDRIRPLLFGGLALPFPVPGMSDVMPYRSTRFSAMSVSQLAAYRAAWRRHVAAAVAEHRPQVIHSHHLWLLSSLVKDVAPTVPLVCHCHATGLRQMALCPHLAGEVRTGCARADRFVVLHDQHGTRLASELGVPQQRVVTVGAGYRQDLFHATAGDGERDRPRLLYIGKYSAAKGLPWLLDAFALLAAGHPSLELHVAGSGAGAEAEALAVRMRTMPGVVLHGHLAQAELARLMRRCTVCVLPSFYEGVPLVLVEALACGCRLVATGLPGVRQVLEPHIGAALEMVPLPRLRGIDTPDPADLPGFVADLTEAVDRVLALPPLGDPQLQLPGALDPFTWSAVFARVEKVWHEVMTAGSV